MRKAE
jgi:hypothetical protein